ncbi:MAG: hypothetical protein ACE5EC_06840, partial [Phycisphaerae bacterium]
ANAMLFAAALGSSRIFDQPWIEAAAFGTAFFMTLLHIIILIGRILVVMEDNSVMIGLLGAHSGDRDRLFRRIATICSD